jgi:hypothetical protein
MVVRGTRYTGKSRLLRRMLLGVVDSLEAEAEQKGGLEHLLHGHFAKVYKVAAPRDLFECA